MKIIEFYPNVIRTEITDKVIEKLDYYFDLYKHEVFVTSVLRTKESQLRIMTQYAQKLELIDETCILNDTDKMQFDNKEIFVWQFVWSWLLEKGILIAPIERAEIVSGIRKGQFRNPSNHLLGKAFDLCGKEEDRSPDDELVIVQEAMQVEDIGIERILIERKQNCLHIDCKV